MTKYEHCLNTAIHFFFQESLWDAVKLLCFPGRMYLTSIKPRKFLAVHPGDFPGNITHPEMTSYFVHILITTSTLRANFSIFFPTKDIHALHFGILSIPFFYSITFHVVFLLGELLVSVATLIFERAGYFFCQTWTPFGCGCHFSWDLKSCRVVLLHRRKWT